MSKPFFKLFNANPHPTGWPNERKDTATMRADGSPVIAYGQVHGRGWTQEHYESSTGDAAVRARHLRKVGFDARTSSLGEQVTPVGRVKMSMVDVRHKEGQDGSDLPPVKVERL